MNTCTVCDVSFRSGGDRSPIWRYLIAGHFCVVYEFELSDMARIHSDS
jgi:hypothetical protein